MHLFTTRRRKSLLMICVNNVVLPFKAVRQSLRVVFVVAILNVCSHTGQAKNALSVPIAVWKHEIVNVT